MTKNYILGFILTLSAVAPASAEVVCRLGAVDFDTAVFLDGNPGQIHRDPEDANAELHKLVDGKACRLEKVDCDIGGANFFGAILINGKIGYLGRDIKAIIAKLKKLHASGSCKDIIRVRCRMSASNYDFSLVINGQIAELSSDASRVMADFNAIIDAGFGCPDAPIK